MAPSHKKVLHSGKSDNLESMGHSDAPVKSAATTPLVGDLGEALSTVLKQAAAALRQAMADELRPLDLSVAQHSCLELLGRSPGLSSADIARGAFVSRQSMNLVLRGLQDRGFVTRPETAPQGRALPTKLTREGRTALNAANVVAREVEKRMISAVPEKRRAKFRRDLSACAEALIDG